MSATAAPHDHWHTQPTLESLQAQDIWQLRAAFLEKFFPVADDLQILEAGSGPAHDSIRFAQRGAHVTALDCSHAGLDLAKQFYSDLQLPLQTAHGDLQQIPFDDDSFDLAFNGGVLEHFDDDELATVIDEMVRVVRPGGIVLAFCPNRHNVFYQHHLKKIAQHSYEFERAFTASEMKQRFESRGLPHVRVSGVHVHPAPNYFLPTWLPKVHRIEPWCRALFAPLERSDRHHRINSLIGQDFVIWAAVPARLGERHPLSVLGGGPAVREQGRAAA